MPHEDHWLVASKMIEVLDRETARAVLDHGGLIGGGWCEVHQHICVNESNREAVENLLHARGFTVSEASEYRVRHPEIAFCHAVKRD